MRNSPHCAGPLTRRRLIYYSALAASAIALTSPLAPFASGAAAEPAGKAAPEWDALFQRESGWIGADGVYSIPLTGDTTLWLFSDTFVGKVKDGKRLDARMINNSIALQRGTNQPEFFYGTAADGQPASFIKPEHGSRRDYFWLCHGVRTTRGLYFFLQRVVTVKPGTPFGFKLVDGWLACVANPDDPPPQWRITQTKVPFTRRYRHLFKGQLVQELLGEVACLALEALEEKRWINAFNSSALSDTLRFSFWRCFRFNWLAWYQKS